MISVGGLAAGIAHEINNPLAGIIHSAEVLKQRLSSVEIQANLTAAAESGIDIARVAMYNEKRHIPKLTENILQAALRAADIVSNMLGFARKSDQKMSAQNINDILQQTITLASIDYNLKKKYDFKHILIETRFTESPPSIQCRLGKLQQVFFNILKNGAEAMYESKEQKAPHFKIETNVHPKLKMVSATISDNGQGIEPAVLRHVFDPFFTTKKRGKGTGLGLSLAYRIITEEHGGTLEVKSSPGEGATFIVMLPFNEES